MNVARQQHNAISLSQVLGGDHDDTSKHARRIKLSPDPNPGQQVSTTIKAKRCVCVCKCCFSLVPVNGGAPPLPPLTAPRNGGPGAGGRLMRGAGRGGAGGGRRGRGHARAAAGGAGRGGGAPVARHPGPEGQPQSPAARHPQAGRAARASLQMSWVTCARGRPPAARPNYQEDNTVAGARAVLDGSSCNLSPS